MKKKIGTIIAGILLVAGGYFAYGAISGDCCSADAECCIADSACCK